MIYEFKRLADGKKVEQSFPMGMAPKVGEQVTLEGHPCVRVLSMGFRTSVQRTVSPFASQTIDPAHARELGHKRFDSMGSPVFSGRREAEALAKRSEGHRAQIHFDAAPTRSERAAYREPAKAIAKRRAGM